MGKCALCEKPSEFWFGTLCEKCRKIKHYISIHDDRVYQILDNVLSRSKDKQILKEAEEIKEEIIQKQHTLKEKKSVSFKK